MDEIEKILKEKLAAEVVQVIDDSPQHAGHLGALSGGGHFSVLVVSSRFEGKGMIDRHREIYAALNMGNNPAIHALSIISLTPEEYKARRK